MKPNQAQPNANIVRLLADMRLEVARLRNYNRDEYHAVLLERAADVIEQKIILRK